MKKILLVFLLVASLAIGGDIDKCSHSLKEYAFWEDRANNYESPLSPYTSLIRDEATDMADAWRKEILKYCAGILREDIYVTHKDKLRPYAKSKNK